MRYVVDGGGDAATEKSESLLERIPVFVSIQRVSKISVLATIAVWNSDRECEIR